MQILNFIFHIGVVLAVYNFLWWLIMLLIKILRAGQQKMLFEVYFIKAIRYLFLADVIFMVAIEEGGGVLHMDTFLIAGLVLLIYFVGQLQKNQTKNTFFTVRTSTNMQGVLKNIRPPFDIRYEVFVVTLAMALYIAFYMYPDYAYNPIANWFLDNITGIEQAPVFGFIFKVIGFFFLLSVLSKIFNGVMAVLFGQRFTPPSNNFYDEDDDDHFDDYTEVE